MKLFICLLVKFMCYGMVNGWLLRRIVLFFDFFWFCDMYMVWWIVDCDLSVVCGLIGLF